MRILAISDIHGGYRQLQALLDRLSYRPKVDNLIFCGDYINRGSQSLEVLRYVMRTVEKKEAIALKGNHEQMFLEFMESKNLEYDQNFLLNVGGEATIESFLSNVAEKESLFNDMKKLKDFIKTHFRKEIEFIKHLPLLYEDDHHIYVHAGIDPFNWKETDEETALWSGRNFIEYPTYLKKPVIFGHVPTNYIRENRDHAPWFSPSGDKIGIDGGCGFPEGQLNGLIYKNGIYNFEYIR